MNPSSSCTVRVSALAKAYGANQVLRNINLEVARGEVVVIMGPSGSGKTTFIRSIIFNINRKTHRSLSSFRRITNIFSTSRTITNASVSTKFRPFVISEVRVTHNGHTPTKCPFT